MPRTRSPPFQKDLISTSLLEKEPANSTHFYYEMGTRWSTPQSSSSSPGGTQQAISPAAVAGSLRAKQHGSSARHAGCESPSSTSMTRAAALGRARFKRRRRRMKKKGLGNISRVVTVNVTDADKTAAAEVARQLVGERVLLYWPRIAAWYVRGHKMIWRLERNSGLHTRSDLLDSLLLWALLVLFVCFGTGLIARYLSMEERAGAHAGSIKCDTWTGCASGRS